MHAKSYVILHAITKTLRYTSTNGASTDLRFPFSTQLARMVIHSVESACALQFYFDHGVEGVNKVMGAMRKVAVVGVSISSLSPQTRELTPVKASGNLGQPITAALVAARYDVTIITRPQSTTAHPPDIPVTRTPYDLQYLTDAFAGQDAVVCVVGAAGVAMQNTLIDAAIAAGVQRFIIDDFGWGPEMRNLPELDAIFAERRACAAHADSKAAANPGFTWTGVASGSPIDRVLRLFPAMGFDFENRVATIYDTGTECFTGTTLAGIGAAIVGVLRHPEQTANRFVKVLSIKTCQNELLAAFKDAVAGEWRVKRSSARELIEHGREAIAKGDRSGARDIAIAQIFNPGEARCVVAPSWEESDSGLLGVEELNAAALVAMVIAQEQSK